MYLYQDNNQNGLPDYSFVPKANYIYNMNSSKDYDLIQLMSWTNVEYYMSTGNMLYTKDLSWNIWIMDNMLFRLQSWAFEYKKPIRSIGAFRYVNAEIPTLTWINDPIVAIRYNHLLKKANWYDGTSTSSYRYRLVPSLDYFWEPINISYVTNNTKRARSAPFTHSICANYNIQRCGDKKRSTHTGYYLNNTFHPVVSWVSTWFTPEVCDSNTETGAACVNGTVGCCNATCSGFGWGFCGDGVPDNALELIAPPQQLLVSLPESIRNELIQSITSAAAWQTEECDSWFPNPENGAGNWFDGECSIWCRIQPSIVPDIIFEW